MTSFFKPSILALITAFIIATRGCGAGDVAANFGAGYSYLDSGAGAADAYPNLKPFDAARRHATDQYKIIAARQTSPEEKREVAGAFYLGFAQYNARALPEYCRGVSGNLYPQSFVTGFHKMNAREEAALADVLAQAGTTQDTQWAKHERKMMSRAKYDLMGGNISPGSYSSCKKIKDEPKFFLNRTNFKKQFPVISRDLTQ